MGLRQMILLTVALAFAFAPKARAQAYDSAVAAALDSGQPRLALYALAYHDLDAHAGAIDRLNSRYGLGPLPAQDLAFGFSPLIYSDSNINGGTPGSVLMVGGIPFTIDAASRAVSGAVAGARIMAEARASPARGLVVELTASAFAARAVQRDELGRRHSVAGQQAKGCAGAYLGHAQWLDFCASSAQTRRSMVQTDLRSYSLSYARQFTMIGGFAEAQLGAKAQDTGGYRRTSVEMGLTHASAALGTLLARGEWFGRVSGQHGPLFSAEVALTRPIAGKTTTLFASLSQEGGAQFFGADRRDMVRSFGMSRALSPRATLTLRWDDRRSTLSNYSEKTLGFDIRFTGLSFGLWRSDKHLPLANRNGARHILRRFQRARPWQNGSRFWGLRAIRGPNLSA